MQESYEKFENDNDINKNIIQFTLIASMEERLCASTKNSDKRAVLILHEKSEFKEIYDVDENQNENSINDNYIIKSTSLKEKSDLKLNIDYKIQPDVKNPFKTEKRSKPMKSLFTPVDEDERIK